MFEYATDYQYSYIFLVEKIYDQLKHFDDLHIIKNNRNDGRFLNAETPKINLKGKNTINIKFESKSSKLINNNKYTYAKERIKLYNKYNIKNFMMLLTHILMTVVIFILMFSFPSDILMNLQFVELSSTRSFRVIYLLIPFLLVGMYNSIRKMIISPTAVIENDNVVHTVRAIPFIGNKIRESHRIYDGDLSMAFHNNKVMFELPIENKHSYIENEIYYNNTSFALNGIEVDMEKALQDGEGFVHELNHIYYLSNVVYVKLKLPPKIIENCH